MTFAFAGAIALVWTSEPLRRTVPWALAIVVAVEAPVLGFLGSLACLLTVSVKRFRSARKRARRLAEELASLCDLSAVGLAGGLGIQAAIEIASHHIGGELASEISAVMRQAQIVGVAVALSEAEGVGTRLYRVVGQAAATGAPLGDAVLHLADDLNAELATQKIEAIRRLPVAMLFPLTLLILPGFLMLTLAPALLDAFATLSF